MLKWAVHSLPPPWDSRWKEIGRKPYDSRALTVVTIWQEIEVKPERAYTADLERDKRSLRMLGFKYAPHRTVLYRTRKRLSEEYMRRLTGRSLKGSSQPRRLARTPRAYASQGGTAPGLQLVKAEGGNT